MNVTPFKIALLSALLTALSFEIFSKNNWGYAEPMKTARSEIQAAVLDDKIIVAGGISFFSTTNDCETFSLTHQSWKQCADLPVKLHHVALTASRSSIYAGGGYTNLFFNHLRNPPLWKMDSSLKSWEQVSELPYSVGEHELVYFKDRIYLIGGNTKSGATNKVWSYDIPSKKWLQAIDMPTRRHSMASVVFDNKIWVIGGRQDGGKSSGAVEVFDPAENTWQVLAELPVPRGGLVAATINSEVHVIGGESLEGKQKVLDDHFKYDENLNVWTKMDTVPTPRHGAAIASNGSSLYIIGGGTKPGLRTVYSVSATVQTYHP